MESEREGAALREVSVADRRLFREANDLASLMLLRAFCRLFTAGCLEMRSEWDPPLYRRAAGVDLALLSPEERILAESAGETHGECLEDLLLTARQRIRTAMPASARRISAREASAFGQLRAEVLETLRGTISEALAYEPPVSSCSV